MWKIRSGGDSRRQGGEPRGNVAYQCGLAPADDIERLADVILGNMRDQDEIDIVELLKPGGAWGDAFVRAAGQIGVQEQPPAVLDGDLKGRPAEVTQINRHIFCSFT